MIKVSHNYCFPKGNDIFTPRSKPVVMPLATHEGESGGENTLASGSVPSTKAKGKQRADAPPIEPVRRSAQHKMVHDYSKLNDPLPDLEEIPNDNDNDNECHLMSLAEIVYQAFTETNLQKGDPKTLKEAKPSPEWPEWEKAIQAKLKQLREMGTWNLVDPPKG